MPILNKTRFTNVKYNMGKLYYDNMIFDTKGANTLIDFVNGGGKSLAIQLIVNTILPNSRVQADWDFKELFDPSNKNTTLHMQTEWVLEGNTEYKYLIAGFCAQKAKRVPGDEGDKYAFDRFAYICMYNNQNENDLTSMPLKKYSVDGKAEYMSLKELKSHLASIKSKDYYTEVFTTISEYKRRLGRYNITASEWEIIRDVNKDEMYVPSYFRQYPTAEKFIKEFLIPRIEGCHAGVADYEYQDSNKLAESLIAIREQLEKLAETKGQKSDYEKATIFIERVALELERISEAYGKREDIYRDIKKSIKYLKEMNTELGKEEENLSKKLESDEQKKETLELHMNIIATRIEEIELRKSEEVLKNADLLKEEANRIVIDKEKEIAVKKSENIVIDKLKEEEEISKLKAELEAAKLSNLELYEKRDNVAGEVKYYLNQKQKKTKKQVQNISTEISELDMQINDYQIEVNDCNGNIKFRKNEGERLEREKETLAKERENVRFGDIETTTKDLTAKLTIETEIEAKTVLADLCKKEISKLEGRIDENKGILDETNMKLVELKTKIDHKENEYAKIEPLKTEAEVIIRKYEEKDYPQTVDSIKKYREKLRVREREIINRKEDIEKILEGLKNSSISPSSDTYKVFDILKGKYQSAKLGVEFIKNLELDERVHFVKNNELIPYGILLEKKDYANFIKDDEILEAYFGSAIPVINAGALDEQTMFISKNTIFTVKSVEFYKNEAKIADLRKAKEEELSEIKLEIDAFEKEYTNTENNLKVMESLVVAITNINGYDKFVLELSNMKEDRERLDRDILEYKEMETSLTSDKLGKEKEKSSIEKEIECLKDKIKLIEEYIKITKELEERIKGIIENKDILEKLNKTLNEYEVFLRELKDKRNINIDKNKGLNKELEDIDNELGKVSYIELSGNEKLVDDNEFTVKLTDFISISEKLEGRDRNIHDNEEKIKTCSDRIERCINQINTEGFKIEDFHYINKFTSRNTQEVLQRYTKELEEVKKQRNIIEKRWSEAFSKKSSNEGIFNKSVENLSNIREIDYNIIWKEIKDIYRLEDEGIEEKKKELLKEIKRLKSNIPSIKNEIKCITDKIRDGENELFLFNNLNDEIKIEITVDNSPLDKIVYAKDIQGKLSMIEKEIRKAKGSYDKTIDKMDDTVIQVIKINDIVKELKELPVAKIDLDARIDGLVKNDDCMIALIKEEIERVDEEITELSCKKNDFVDLCIQKGENIYRDVKKLGDMSVVEIRGHKQPLIEVNLKKLKEDEAKEKMSSYIENLIATCDEIEDIGEKNIMLAEGLRVDKIFSQVIGKITPNAIRIYKLEDMENERVNDFLNLDRAYGSKGQTSSLYMMLLVCMISYLRKLHSTSVDESTKVVVLDGAFSGVASEILWYPILKLAEVQKVQLIVFAFKVQPSFAVTFDTKYVLEKEPMEGKESVIVKNFESNQNTEELEYNPLEGKFIGTQTMFDF